MYLQSDRPVSIPDEEDGTLALIRMAAEETLAVWPGARAAVLFGSRARGDHSALSDWDIAFITGEGERVEPIPPGLPMDSLSREEGLDVQCLALPERVARRKACAIGHVARGIFRDGKLLAGIWDRSEPEGDRVRMQPREYWRFCTNALERAVSAVQAAERLGKTVSWNVDASACDSFVVLSADAAEYLAKAMLGRNGIDCERSHNLSALADLARRAGQDGLARSILSMNGLTQKHHVAPYDGATAKDCRHAVKRFLAMVPLLAEEIVAGEEDSRLTGRNADSLKAAALLVAREHSAGLRAAADRPPGEAPDDDDDEFDPETFAALAAARPDLAAALDGLEAALAGPGAGPPPPSPFD